MKKSARLVVVLVLLLIGAWFRLAELAKPSFFIDELYHVVAAKSLNSEGRLELPSGRTYPRAHRYTYLVAQSFRWFGESEATARLPSVVLGFLSLGVLFAALRPLFGLRVATLASLLLLFSPLTVFYSRECRFYSLVHLLHLVAVFSLYFALFGRSSSEARPGVALRSGRRLFMGLVCVAAAWLAYSDFSPTIVLLPAALAAILLSAAGRKLEQRGYPRASPILLFGSLSALVFLGTALQGPGGLLVRQLISYLPKWAETNQATNAFYLTTLTNESGFFWLIALLSIPAAFRYGHAKAHYFALQFFVPLIVLSFVPLKSPRIFYPFYSFGAVLVAIGLSEALDRLESRPPDRASSRRPDLLYFGAVFVLLLAATSVALGWLRSERIFLPKPPWREAGALLARRVPDDATIATDNSIAMSYYFGRVDLLMDENILDLSRTFDIRAPDGTYLDPYTHARLVSTIEDFQQQLLESPDLWVVLGHPGSHLWDLDYFIRTEGRRIPLPAISPEIEVFRLDAASAFYGCAPRHPDSRGRFVLVTEPDSTYILYAAGFSIDPGSFPPRPEHTYILQIESLGASETLEITDLPVTGFSFCGYRATGMDLAGEIAKPLTLPLRCGVDCQQVRHVLWRRGPDTLDVRLHTRGQTNEARASRPGGLPRP